jgi:guanylate kinase
MAARLLIFSGPSGAGKTTLVRRVVDSCPLPLKLSVSATTRPPRAGEVDGIDYHFLSAEEFQRRREEGAFAECAEVFGKGYWYGTLRSEISTSVQAGQSVVLEIDVEGMQQVVSQFPDALTFFVQPGSLEELERRLRGRSTENEESIARRLKVAREELQFASAYKYQIVNDSLDRAVQEICQILQTMGDKTGCSKN